MPSKPSAKSKLKSALKARALPYAVEKSILLAVKEAIDLVKGGDKARRVHVEHHSTGGKDGVELLIRIAPTE
jgi:hypothetical protein